MALLLDLGLVLGSPLALALDLTLDLASVRILASPQGSADRTRSRCHGTTLPVVLQVW